MKNWNKFSVFVGWTEVNDYFLSKEDAENLKYGFIEDWYDEDDIQIVSNEELWNN